MVFLSRVPDSVREQVNKLVNLALSSSLDIYAILLFGSCARGTQRCDSDIDIAIITNGEYTRQQRAMLWCEFDEAGADLIIFTKEYFAESGSTIADQIRKDGVILWIE